MTDFDQAAARWDENAYRADRARVVAAAIRERVPVSAGMAALEYGCGTGLLSFALQPFPGPMTLADNSTGMLAVVEQKIAAGGFTNMHARLLDLSKDAPPDLRVRLVYTLMTLHHIPDVERVLRGFYTLLEAPGYLCAADLDAEDGSFHGPGFDGHKGFERAALGRMAEGAGFRNVAFQTVYQTPRKVENAIRHFPLFLMTAEK